MHIINIDTDPKAYQLFLGQLEESILFKLHFNLILLTVLQKIHDFKLYGVPRYKCSKIWIYYINCTY